MRRSIQIMALSLSIGVAVGHNVKSCDTEDKIAQYLFVQQAGKAQFIQHGHKQSLVVHDIDKKMVFFSDAPKRRAGHITPANFLKAWESSGHKPINIAISGQSNSGQETRIVVTMQSARIKGKSLIIDYTPIHKNKLQTFALNDVNLFIDGIPCGDMCL